MLMMMTMMGRSGRTPALLPGLPTRVLRIVILVLSLVTFCLGWKHSRSCFIRQTLPASPRHQSLRRHASKELSSEVPSPKGLFRPFMEHAWAVLKEQEQIGLEPSDDIPLELQSNQAAAKGNVSDRTVVRMETAALVPKNTTAIAYARCALLETVDPSSSLTNATSGIQVMNLVVFPSQRTDLPVWGVDLVSLPGDKHLLAMDAQPMSVSPQKRQLYEERWNEWYQNHVQDVFEWGGDIPEPATKFFSSNALWTRLQGPEAIPLIQDQVYHAFCDHLALYLQLLQDYSSSSLGKENDLVSKDHHHHQDEYFAYRLANDPARPMLRSLYGPEWTERLLEEVLFPDL